MPAGPGALFHESVRQDLGHWHADVMSDSLVIWLGALTAFDPNCLKYANEAQVLFHHVKEEHGSRWAAEKNFE